jgi:MFS family permease
MYYTYFVSVLTTIEKLYQIQSKTTGMIMSATEIGQIGGALLLTYYGGHGHRPKWIACGMLIFAFASVLCSTPHYLFGSDIGIKSSPVKSDSTETMASLKLREHSLKLCFNSLSSEPSSALSTSSSSDYSSNNLLNTDIKYGLNSSNLNQSESLSTNSWSDSKCDHPEVINTKTRITTTVLSIFFVSLLLIGIGATAVNTLGIPYIDDNVAPKESPLYFGINIKTFYKLFHCSN